MVPLSFQPWPLDKPQPPNIIDVLTRVQAERGQLFRNITEASLAEEIAADGALSPSQNTSSDGEQDDEPADNQHPKDGQPVSREQLQRAKLEMLQQVGVAHNEVMMALDFVALLESEHAPQAQNSMSQALKDGVPPKTLGTDVWARMPADEARRTQDQVLARNVKMRSLQRSADDILGAARRLEDNVRRETQFWDQMLSISGKGWSVCRVPRSKRLGVRYGFSESAGEFSSRSLAALHSNADGSISLERGFGSKPRGLRVTVVRNGNVTGRSYLPAVSDDSETTLEARIRHARDSIFDEELFREMTRECRAMVSLGVTMRGQTIRLPTATMNESASTEVHLDLVPLEQETGVEVNASNPDDATAQALALGSRLILSQAHRDKLKRRSEFPAPMAERAEEKPVMSILKPLTSFLLHKSSLDAVNAYITKATEIIKLGKIDITVSQAAFQLPESAQITNAEELVTALNTTFASTARIELKPPASEIATALTIDVETSLAQTQSMSSTFTLHVPDQRYLHFDTIEDLAETTDAALASLLAAALGSRAEQNWDLDPREAVLSFEPDGRDEKQLVWIVVDSGAGRLVLMSKKEKLLWEVGGEGPGVGFWKGWEKVA
ncbi:Mediator of RNA polymerase II transcription subunit 17 [Cladosporium halotolerans]|uniref:Mediator of RNA polymerase II transcription subunit 17 n=1 Tax=Cladosporium halotolerans TaxID=1052096 RepID=A0AB34L156_9PEZI